MMTTNRQSGFTMIEMLLSMAFVAFLMVTIAMTTISMAQTYQRGITLSNVNAAGRAVSTDIERTMSQSQVNAAGGGVKTTTVKDGATVVAGALCLGQYSYVWNLGAAVGTSTPGVVKYSDGDVNDEIRLIKVADASQAYCAHADSITVSTHHADATELLPSDGAGNTTYNGLALQSAITVKNGPSGATQALYKVQFALGTNNQEALLGATGCKPPSSGGSDLAYCAVNQFDFIVRAGGGSS